MAGSSQLQPVSDLTLYIDNTHQLTRISSTWGSMFPLSWAVARPSSDKKKKKLCYARNFTSYENKIKYFFFFNFLILLCPVVVLKKYESTTWVCFTDFLNVILVFFFLYTLQFEDTKHNHTQNTCSVFWFFFFLKSICVYGLDILHTTRKTLHDTLFAVTFRPAWLCTLNTDSNWHYGRGTTKALACSHRGHRSSLEAITSWCAKTL